MVDKRTSRINFLEFKIKLVVGLLDEIPKFNIGRDRGLGVEMEPDEHGEYVKTHAVQYVRNILANID